MTLKPTVPLCPRCRNPLLPSQRPGYAFAHCGACGLAFFDRTYQCPTCLSGMGKHIIRCPSQPRGERVLCPLCGAPRHRKDKRMSFLVCSWRQWAISSGQIPPDAEPTTPLPNDTDIRNMTAYRKWMSEHADLEAGSVPAERVFRQRMREHGTLQPA